MIKALAYGERDSRLRVIGLISSKHKTGAATFEIHMEAKVL